MDKKKLKLIYPCVVCGEQVAYSTGPRLIQHLGEEHELGLKPRSRGSRSPLNKEFDYVRDGRFDFQQFACPSCWFHSNDIEELKDHISKEHTFTQSTHEKKKNTGRKVQIPNYDSELLNEVRQQFIDFSRRFKKVIGI